MQNPTRGPTCTPSVTRVIHIPRIAPQPRIPCILLHTTATVIMISAYHTLTKLPRHAVISAQYGGQFQYLTVQGLFMTCTTSFITLVIELFFSNDSDLGNHASASWELLLKKSINHIKYILITIAMPLSLTISLIYWPLLVFATQFILQNNNSNNNLLNTLNKGANPAPVEISSFAPLAQIPLLLDLSLHFVPGVTLVLDFLVFGRRKFGGGEMRQRQRQRQMKRERWRCYPEMLLILGYTVFYAWWVERCAAFNEGRFPYPLLTENPFEVRIGVYTGVGVLVVLVFWVVHWVHG